jgi:hypothetical protein
MASRTIHTQINQLADDTGRLRRRTAGSPLEHLVDRVAYQIEALYLLTTPTAAQLAACTAPGDEQAVTEAVRVADAGYRALQQRLAP